MNAEGDAVAPRVNPKEAEAVATDPKPEKVTERTPREETGGEDNDFFSCNICYETAIDPVVSLCGHMYCWPCLYRWIQVSSHSGTCPVCKAGVDASTVIPIFGRGGDGVDPRTESRAVDGGERIPDRPPPRRPPVRPGPVSVSPLGAAGVGGPGLDAQGPGLVPVLLGMRAGGIGLQEQLTQEQQHQAFLSRLLLMLGSFVILCLLLF